MIQKISGYIHSQRALMKPLLFTLTVYLALPLLFSLIKISYAPKYTYNLFSFASYSFVLLMIIFVLRKEIFSRQYTSDLLLKKILFGFFSYMFFLLYFLFKFKLPLTDLNYAFNITSAIFSYLLGIIFFAFLVFGSDFFRKNFKEVFSVLSLLSLYYVLTSVLWNKWLYFSDLVGKSVFWLLSLLISDAGIFFEADGPLIRAKEFTVSIGAPCSGIDSLSIFLGIFLILILYEHQNLNKWRLATVLGVGVFLVLIMNLIRVTSIILLGTVAPTFALGIFHSQIGALLFILFIVFFLEALYWWMEH